MGASLAVKFEKPDFVRTRLVEVFLRLAVVDSFAEQVTCSLTVAADAQPLS